MFYYSSRTSALLLNNVGQTEHALDQEAGRRASRPRCEGAVSNWDTPPSGFAYNEEVALKQNFIGEYP